MLGRPTFCLQCAEHSLNLEFLDRSRMGHTVVRREDPERPFTKPEPAPLHASIRICDAEPPEGSEGDGQHRTLQFPIRGGAKLLESGGLTKPPPRTDLKYAELRLRDRDAFRVVHCRPTWLQLQRPPVRADASYQGRPNGPRVSGE